VRVLTFRIKGYVGKILEFICIVDVGEETVRRVGKGHRRRVHVRTSYRNHFNEHG